MTKEKKRGICCDLISNWQDPFQESSEHPKLTAINAKLRERQEAQETREREVKTELVQKAANYLEDFYKVKDLMDF